MKEEYIDEMISYLKTFIGIRYKFGGNSPRDEGFDCSGLILEGLRSIGMWGKRDDTARGIFTSLISSLRIMEEKPKKGCLLFFGLSRQEITHVALAINDFQMIEAGGTNNSGFVRIRAITWRNDIVAILPLMEDKK